MKQLLSTIVPMLLLAVAITTRPALAQEQPAVPKAQLEKLTQFVGQWMSTEAGYEGAEGKMEFEMKMEAAPILNGFAVEFSVSAEIAEVGDYLEKDFLAFDPYEQMVSLMTVSNFGEVAKYTGNWGTDDDNVLHLSGTRMMDGKEVTSTVTITFLDDETFTWTVEVTADGEQAGRFWAKLEKE